MSQICVPSWGEDVGLSVLHHFSSYDKDIALQVKKQRKNWSTGRMGLVKFIFIKFNFEQIDRWNQSASY